MAKVVNIRIAPGMQSETVFQGYRNMDFLVSAESPVNLTGSQLRIDEIALQWHRLDGDLKIFVQPQEDSKIFFFVQKGTFSRVSGRPDPQPVLNAVFPTEEPETIRLEDGCEYASASIPNSLFQKRLSGLMGRPVEKQIAFENFPDPSLESLKILREHLNGLESSSILKTSKFLGSRNESLRNLMVDCFLMMFPNNFSSVLSQDSPRIAPRHVKRALDYIHSNPNRHIEPQLLADLSSVSKRTLQYSFQSVMGQTISDYQRLLRLHHAHAMVVSNPDVPLKVVAEMWGFRSHAAFGQSFKKAFGIAPSDARRDRIGSPKG